MIQVLAAVRVFVCTQPTDMRKGFDGLTGLAEHVLQQDPLSGHLFVFRNRARNRLKVLYWDQDGLAIWYKRLERGTFQLPSDLLPADAPPVGAEISAGELSLLLGGIELASVKRRKRYRHPAKPP
ncbi:MAG: IS66 family insertion sequence element accessory protein TnpB [Pirellulaceae bacterium]